MEAVPFCQKRIIFANGKVRGTSAFCSVVKITFLKKVKRTAGWATNLMYGIFEKNKQ